MDELTRIRLETRGFAADVGAMRASLEGVLGAGADRAGRAVEASLLRAVRTGKLGFEDLKRVAIGSLDAIAAAAVRSGLDAILGGRTGGVVGRGTPGACVRGPPSCRCPARLWTTVPSSDGTCGRVAHP